MRSDTVKKGYEKAPHRSLLRAVGLKDADFEKPFIGVANSYVRMLQQRQQAGFIYVQPWKEALRSILASLRRNRDCMHRSRRKKEALGG